METKAEYNDEWYPHLDWCMACVEVILPRLTLLDEAPRRRLGDSKRCFNGPFLMGMAPGDRDLGTPFAAGGLRGFDEPAR